MPPVNVRVPAPNLARAPVPLMVCVRLNASERLICSVPLLLTAPVPKVPAVPPLPISSVPAEIVVAPV